MQSKEQKVEEDNCTLYGISDEEGFCFDFTTDIKQAECLADFLNKNDVEPCHVPEIIEDLFYSCR